jgi:hypothetical protein
MDDRRPAFPHHKVCEPIGSDAAQNAQRESSLVVYCGTDQQVSEGFALQIMGLDTSFLPVGIVLATDAPNTEDD